MVPSRFYFRLITKMDPSLYVKYNRLQMECSRKFIESIAPFATAWNLEFVMDIGCGPGNTSTYWIDHYISDIQKLIGIDIDPEMIDLAKLENTKNGEIEYYVADITEKSSVREWEGRVTAAISAYVFHRVPDQRQAFKNVFDLLKPCGVAAITFVAEGPFYKAFQDLLQTPKWRPILEPTNFLLPEAMVKKYDVADYKKMIEDTGFSVSHCIMEPVDFSYETDEECKNLLMSLHSIGEVSNELKEEYKLALFEQFVKHSPRDSKGRPTHNAILLQALLYKNKSND